MTLTALAEEYYMPVEILRQWIADGKMKTEEIFKESKPGTEELTVCGEDGLRRIHLEMTHPKAVRQYERLNENYHSLGFEYNQAQKELILMRREIDTLEKMLKEKGARS